MESAGEGAGEGRGEGQGEGQGQGQGEGHEEEEEKNWRWAGRSRWKEMPGRPLSTLASHARSQVVVVWTCLGHL